MKCKNCGAELNNGKCEYCGSVCFENMYYLPIVNVDEDALQRALQNTRIMPQEEIEITCLGDKERHFVRGI